MTSSLLLAACSTMLADTAAERLHESATVMTEILSAPDNGIPQKLLDQAHCVVVVPGVKKAAFLVGGKFGKGFVTCRNSSGEGWGSVAAVRVEGGSFGFQIGASETDLVLLVMNQRGMERLEQSKFTVGGDAEVAAGPVGRNATAQTDARMTAKILSYSRSRGVFAGISLQGATLRQDEDENAALYQKPLTNKNILMNHPEPPAVASDLLNVLTKYSPKESKS